MERTKIDFCLMAIVFKHLFNLFFLILSDNFQSIFIRCHYIHFYKIIQQGIETLSSLLEVPPNPEAVRVPLDGGRLERGGTLSSLLELPPNPDAVL